MSLTQSFTIGKFTCHTLEAGLQRLDGGAMFGIVPKELWQKRIAPDERNRIPLAMRCLLIEHDAGPILVDTGLGNKESEKFMGIYGVENQGIAGRTQLDDALRAVGFTPDDITMVINTHLHFDHAGGNTWSEGEPDAPAVPAFPNAVYVVQKGELDFASQANERTAGSYLPPNFRPISDAGMWRLVEGKTELLPGIEVVPTPGHTPHHQSVMIADGGDTACFLADLVPTSAHLPLPWIMGYDLEPLVTLETKRWLLAKAADACWTLIFEHDPVRATGRVVKSRKSYEYQEIGGA
jgi:glyoxylase-like metal-dependent hydrolase (beta-lactamase superfamily II)